jgi:SOS-response transcriptional repressor LexA
VSRTLPLTERQERLWRYLRSCETSPSTNEMAEALGDPARGSGVSRTLDALEAKGLIRRTRYRARSVVALDPAADLSNFTTAELAAELARRLAQ